ncbi:MAG: hypothetical protein QGH93_08895, partial [Gammaproteobacteria bacterium]|nr:hypothetical protein [Gammaproteobacteria bacterium]
MLRLLTRIICLSGLILSAESSIAVDIPAAPDRYQVELIVFRHIDQSRNTPETPAAASIFQVSPLNLMLAEIPLQTPQIPSAPLGMLTDTQNKRPSRLPISFQLLELDPSYPYFVPLRADTHTLNQIYARLELV